MKSGRNSKGSKRSKSSNLEEEKKNAAPLVSKLAVPDIRKLNSNLNGS